MKVIDTDKESGELLSSQYGLPTKNDWNTWREGEETLFNFGYIDATEEITQLIQGEFKRASTAEEFAENMKNFLIERKLFVRHANRNFE